MKATSLALMLSIQQAAGMIKLKSQANENSTGAQNSDCQQLQGRKHQAIGDGREQVTTVQ